MRVPRALNLCAPRHFTRSEREGGEGSKERERERGRDGSFHIHIQRRVDSATAV